jgi:hypothetical protein
VSRPRAESSSSTNASAPGLARYEPPSPAGRVADEARMTDGWRDRGRALLRRYDELAGAHTRCTKHRNPKANLAILRAALGNAVLAGRSFGPDGRSGDVRRFLGWQAGERHWLLEPALQA